MSDDNCLQLATDTVLCVCVGSWLNTKDESTGSGK